MKIFALLALLFTSIHIGPALAQAPERDGNFSIRFDPMAKLQTKAEIPFHITVYDPRDKPVDHAKVTLQIKDRDTMNVRDFRAVMIGPGIYMAKPTFPFPGEWSVYVEVHREGEFTARTIQFNVPE